MKQAKNDRQSEICGLIFRSTFFPHSNFCFRLRQRWHSQHLQCLRNKKKNIVYLFEMDYRERTSTKTKNVTDNINVCHRVSLSRQNGSPAGTGMGRRRWQRWRLSILSCNDSCWCFARAQYRAQYRESRPAATNDINHIRANVHCAHVALCHVPRLHCVSNHH